MSLLYLQEPISGPYPEPLESFPLPATSYPQLMQPQMGLLYHYVVTKVLVIAGIIIGWEKSKFQIHFVD